MIGHVYIKGQIGDSEEEQGVSLKSVIMQIEAHKESNLIYVHIDSQGGCVDTGNSIADYLAKQTNVYTIAEGLCASIATRIHLSVPLLNRKIVSGTEYFIHNPLYDGISGNAEELRYAADLLDPVQKELVAMYCKATTASKEAIEGLMNAETSLTDEETKTLGFVSEIIPKQILKAVAFKKKSINKNKLDMSTIADQIKEGLAPVLALIKGEQKVVAMMVVTDKGELSYASEGELPEVGEAVTIEGEIAPEGVYTIEGVAVITVGAEGNVSELVLEGAEPVEDVEALKAKIVELEAAAVASATANTEAITAQAEEFKTELASAVEGFNTEFTAFKATVGSDFAPKAEKKVFSKAAPSKVSARQRMKDRKALGKANLEKNKI